ncbi:MAG: acyltransferase [Flavobacteriia bacterium]|nr:acyltransferase [Flavobacteriia bacterium]
MNKNRIIGLDILRSVAILLVLYSHLRIYCFEYNLYKIRIDGVSVFFVLSGFLIGNILIEKIRTNKLNILHFLIFRWTKTLPSYFVILFLILIYYIVTKQDFSAFNYKYVIFIQNFYTSHPSFFKEAWSLSIEEWMYIFLPLVLILNNFFKIDKLKYFISVFLFFVFISIILRITYYELGIYSSLKEEFRKIILFRFDSIIFGFLVSIFYIYFHNFWKKFSLLSLFLGLICILSIELKLWNYPPLYFTLESIAILFLLPYLSNKDFLPPKTLNYLFYFISKISYSLYLINLSFMQIIFIPFFLKYFSFIVPNNNFILYYYLIFTFFFAILLHYFIEIPFLRLRHKLN